MREEMHIKSIANMVIGSTFNLYNKCIGGFVICPNLVYTVNVKRESSACTWVRTRGAEEPRKALDS